MKTFPSSYASGSPEEAAAQAKDKMVANALFGKPKTFPPTTKKEELPEPAAGNEWVQNLMTQVWVQQAIDTPYVCRVDREAFFSN